MYIFFNIYDLPITERYNECQSKSVIEDGGKSRPYPNLSEIYIFIFYVRFCLTRI